MCAAGRGYEYLQSEAEQPPLLVLENLTGATLGYILDSGSQRLGAADSPTTVSPA